MSARLGSPSQSAVTVTIALAAGFAAGHRLRPAETAGDADLRRTGEGSRGIYAGCIGYFGGEMDACIVLRASVEKDGLMHVQAGAGIVYDSSPPPNRRNASTRRARCSARKKRCGSQCGESAAVAAGPAERGFSALSVDQSGRDRKCLLGCMRLDPSDRLPILSQLRSVRLVLKLTAIAGDRRGLC